MLLTRPFSSTTAVGRRGEHKQFAQQRRVGGSLRHQLSVVEEGRGPLRIVGGQSDHRHVFFPAIRRHVARRFLAMAAGGIVKEQEDVALADIVRLAVYGDRLGHLDTALMDGVVAQDWRPRTPRSLPAQSPGSAGWTACARTRPATSAATSMAPSSGEERRAHGRSSARESNCNRGRRALDSAVRCKPMNATTAVRSATRPSGGSAGSAPAILPVFLRYRVQSPAACWPRPVPAVARTWSAPGMAPRFLQCRWQEI